MLQGCQWLYGVVMCAEVKPRVLARFWLKAGPLLVCLDCLCYLCLLDSISEQVVWVGLGPEAGGWFRDVLPGRCQSLERKARVPVGPAQKAIAIWWPVIYIGCPCFAVRVANGTTNQLGMTCLHYQATCTQLR